MTGVQEERAQEFCFKFPKSASWKCLFTVAGNTSKQNLSYWFFISLKQPCVVAYCHEYLSIHNLYQVQYLLGYIKNVEKYLLHKNEEKHNNKQKIIKISTIYQLDNCLCMNEI